MSIVRRLLILVLLLAPMSFAAAEMHDQPAYPKLADGSVQYAQFPKPLETYAEPAGGIVETLIVRAKADPFNVAASVIFLLAILHTFAASTFTKVPFMTRVGFFQPHAGYYAGDDGGEMTSG